LSLPSDAYPNEVALYVKFKSEGSDKIWNELIRRAGLAERRTSKIDTSVDRRQPSGARA